MPTQATGLTTAIIRQMIMKLCPAPHLSKGWNARKPQVRSATCLLYIPLPSPGWASVVPPFHSLPPTCAMARSFAKHRFQNSLDMIAARSMRPCAQSGTGNAWCIVDSPTLGRMPNVSRRTESSEKKDREDKENPPQSASGALLVSRFVFDRVFPLTRAPPTLLQTVPLPLPMANTAPLNIKKIRRRGLISGAHLALPPSPLPLPVFTPSQSSSTPQTAFTFTAEFDGRQNTFIFTPFESDPPRSTSSSPKFLNSPVPLNVDEGASLPNSPAPSVSPANSSIFALAPRSAALPYRKTWVDDDDASLPSEASASDSEGCDDSPHSDPSTPVSDLFDVAPRSAHRRSISGSTAASSMVDLPSQTQHSASASLPRRSREWPELELPTSVGGSDLGHGFDDLERDVLNSPMKAYAREMWQSTEPDAMSPAPRNEPRKPRLSAIIEFDEVRNTLSIPQPVFSHHL